MPGIVHDHIERQLKAQREAVLDKLGHGHLHPERQALKSYKQYGELRSLDEQIQRERERAFVFAIGAYSANRKHSAEKEMTKALADGVMKRQSEIVLTMKYTTPDSQAAVKRHEDALQAIKPWIEEAEQLGYKVKRGEATAVGLQEGMKIGL